MSHHKTMLLIGCLLLACSARANNPSWQDKFTVERHKALGPVGHHSTDELKMFYVTDKTHPGKPAAVLSPLLSVPPIVGPSETPDKPKKTARKKKVRAGSAPIRQAKPPSIDRLLSKARKAYESGQLEEARRYYTLVGKANPSLTEVQVRLEEIERDLR